jgi:hypothetical protein
MHAHALTHGSAEAPPAAAVRLLAPALIVVMAVGSLTLWIGVPAAILWLWSKLAERYQTVYAAALIGCPLAMPALAWILHRVNGVYLRVTRAPAMPRTHSAWLKSLGGNRGPGQSRGVLEICMSVSVALAVITFTVWFFFFAGSSLAPYN